MPLRILRMKLLPARKAWKTLTTMLRAKLYKFQKSKHNNNRPHQNQLHAIRKQPFKASSSHRLAPQRRNPLAKSSQHRYHKRHVLPKKRKPVYIDDLFIEHTVPGFAGSSLQPHETQKGYKATGGTSGHSREKKSPEFAGSSLQPHETQKGYKATGGTSGHSREKESDKTDVRADDMWESLVLASPQMFGIDERAEEFIAKFREELKTQERLTRSLQY